MLCILNIIRLLLKIKIINLNLNQHQSNNNCFVQNFTSLDLFYELWYQHNESLFIIIYCISLLIK